MLPAFTESSHLVAGTGAGESKQEAAFGGAYNWEPSSDPAFFPGRQARVVCKGAEVGCFGIIHPEVLQRFDIPYPVSALELSINPFCFDQFYRPLASAAPS